MKLFIQTVITAALTAALFNFILIKETLTIAYPEVFVNIDKTFSKVELSINKNIWS